MAMTVFLLLAVAAVVTSVVAHPMPADDLAGRIEVQAHRGGLGMRSEESLWAFAYALEIGVDTLEMDILFTKDGVPVVWHDHYIQETKCTGDYVGQYINNLTLAQIKTLDCSLQLEEHVQQETHLNTRIATLSEVLTLLTCHADPLIRLNLETKLSPLTPSETWPPAKYLDLVPLLASHSLLPRTTIQSFDWRTLALLAPTLPTIALVDPSTVSPAPDGSYPWLAGADPVRDHNGSWIAAAAAAGVGAVSPVHGVPGNLSVNSVGYTAFTTGEVVREAHARGLRVVPWTVDHEVTVAKLLDEGVDGVISNYPERVMAVARGRGLKVGKEGRRVRPECLVGASG